MRRRLAGLVAATTSLVLVVFLVPIALLLRSEAAERAVSAATMEAQSVAQLVPGLSEGSLPADGRVTAFLPDGRTIGAPAHRSESVRLAELGQAFVARSGDGREVLVPVQSSAGVTVIRVAVSADELYDGVPGTLLRLAVLGLALVALGMLVADLLGRRLVRSVGGLASTADRLAAGDLTARAEPDGPSELRRVAVELNRLAEQIDGLLTAARAETADLAHRLRTPLTALRLEIGGLRSADDAERLAESVRALSVEVDELIRTARRLARTGGAADADLAAVARQRLRFWSALAEDTGRPLTGSITDRRVPVGVAEEDLAAAFDVLLDNAFRHTPDDAAVRIAVPDDGRAWVEDAGPGFDPPAVPDDPARAGSTGLGLDIARRTAEAAGGTLLVEPSPLGGARVVLSLSRSSRDAE
jgi:signal transduction histidine kinase